MATQTFVLGEDAIRELESRLVSAAFRFNSLAYGHFSARGEGVVINAYHSGKVVVQGQEVETIRSWFIRTAGHIVFTGGQRFIDIGANNPWKELWVAIDNKQLSELPF